MKLYLDINTHPLVGGSLNTLVLITAHRKSRYRAGGGDLARTNIHFLVFHLTLADTIVSMGEITISVGNEPSRKIGTPMQCL